MGPSGRVEEESMSEECDRCSFAFGYLSEMCLSGGAYVEVIMPTAWKTSVIISLCSEGSLLKRHLLLVTFACISWTALVRTWEGLDSLFSISIK